MKRYVNEVEMNTTERMRYENLDRSQRGMNNVYSLYIYLLIITRHLNNVTEKKNIFRTWIRLNFLSHLNLFSLTGKKYYITTKMLFDKITTTNTSYVRISFLFKMIEVRHPLFMIPIVEISFSYIQMYIILSIYTKLQFFLN